jgi:hypothetical protein
MSDTGTVPASPGQGMAVAALVLGCVSIVFFWLYGITPILAIVFGGVSMNQAKKAGAKPNGMAIAGLVLGVVFTAVAAIMWLAILGSA